MRPSLPPARPVLWPLRPVESARREIRRCGPTTVVHVRHAPLVGVTAEMLAWWYRHVPGTMRYAGETVSRYHVWHPLDHIDYATSDGTSVTVGSRVRISEALQRDPANVFDLTVEVEELEPERAVLGKKVLGSSVIELTNEFATTSRGAMCTTTVRVGEDTAVGRIGLNEVAHHHAFPPHRIRPWMRHHVEEIGNLENFLPELFDSRCEVEP